MARALGLGLGLPFQAGRGGGGGAPADPTLALDLNFLSGALDPRITFTRAGVATYYNSAGVLSTAATNVARFDYNPATLAPRGLLLEEQRTNICLQSQTFNTTWALIGIGATRAADVAVAPDGTTTADQFTAGSAVAEAGLRQTGILYTAASYAVSCYMKSAGTGFGRIRNHSSGAIGYFNLSTGAASVVGSGTVSAEPVGNGWYRCSLVSTCVSTNILDIGASAAAGSTATAGGESIYIWGAQVELGAFPTSYIVTTTAAVTRAIDSASMTGTNFSSWYNAGAGTFVVAFDVATIIGAARMLVVANNGTNAERVQLNAAAALAAVAVVDNNVIGANITLAGSLVANVQSKIGMSFALNDIAGCLNGGTVGADTAATMPAPDRLSLGVDGTGANPLAGHIAAIKFFNVAKADAELQALTAL